MPDHFNPLLPAAAALLLLLASCQSPEPDNSLVEVNGEVTRTREGENLTRIASPTGKQICIQRQDGFPLHSPQHPRQRSVSGRRFRSGMISIQAIVGRLKRIPPGGCA